MHELQRWEPREASLFRLSAEGHSRATLFETLCSPFREAMAHSGSSSSSSSSSNNNNLSSSPFSMICAVHAELYEHRPSADEVLTASHAYSNLCQALGIGPRLAPEGIFEGSAVSGLRKVPSLFLSLSVCVMFLLLLLCSFSFFVLRSSSDAAKHGACGLPVVGL